MPDSKQDEALDLAYSILEDAEMQFEGTVMEAYGESDEYRDAVRGALYDALHDESSEVFTQEEKVRIAHALATEWRAHVEQKAKWVAEAQATGGPVYEWYRPVPPPTWIVRTVEALIGEPVWDRDNLPFTAWLNERGEEAYDCEERAEMLNMTLDFWGVEKRDEPDAPRAH